MRILIVEDNLDSARMMKRLLEREQHTVALAHCADEARIACEQSRFALAICDINLPDESGWALMQELKSRYQLKGIALSALNSAADIVNSHEAGFAAHLAKPLRIDALLSTIRIVASDGTE